MLVLILVLTMHFTVNPLSVSGMHPVWFNVSKWEKGSSHWQEHLLWRRECIHFSPWAGVFIQTQQHINRHAHLPFYKAAATLLICGVYYFCYIYSCTRSLRFHVLLSLWALGKSGTSTLSPNSFLPAVRAEYLIFGFCSTFCLHYFSVNECIESFSVLSAVCLL